MQEETVEHQNRDYEGILWVCVYDEVLSIRNFTQKVKKCGGEIE